MTKRSTVVRAFFIANMGILLFGLSWPLVLGMYWLPLVYLVPMMLGARSFQRWGHRTPREATLDGPNAVGSVLVSWIILTLAFLFLEGVVVRTVVMSLAASTVMVGIVAISLRFIGYYRIPRRRVASQPT